jgi:hypothetical protein
MTADCRPGGGFVGFDPRRQRIQHTRRHTAPAKVLCADPELRDYPTSRDVPEGTSSGDLPPTSQVRGTVLGSATFQILET